MKGHRLLMLAAVLLAVFAFTACGGGGDSPPGGGGIFITGTAAAGSPIAGIVNVKGAAGGTASSTIGTDGSFSLDVSSLTAPYILYAEGTAGGKSVKLYSSGLEAGTINITPITDFIVRQALAGDAGAAYAAWDGTLLDAAALSAAETAVQSQLQPLLDATGVDAGVDLISSSFNADHTGMDQALDILSITYDASGTTATVTNNITGSTYTDDVTTAADDAGAGLPATDASGTGSALSDGETIAGIWAELVAAAGSPAAVGDWINTYAAADYLEEGRDKTVLYDQWVNQGDGPVAGMSLTSTVNGSIEPPPAAYVRAYWIEVVYSLGTESGSMTTQMAFDGTGWFWLGDQTWVNFWPKATAVMEIDELNTTYTTGLHISADDELNYAYDGGARSAIVTGPGLPATGAVLGHQFPETYFSIYDEATGLYPGGSYIMTDDAAIGQIPDNSEYTITLCSEDVAALAASPASCTPLNSITRVIARRPLMNSELTAGRFPAITSPTGHTLTDANNIAGPLTIDWTNTPGVCVESGGLGWEEGTTSYRMDAEISQPCATTVTIDPSGWYSGTPTSAFLWLEGYDMYGREFKVDWGFADAGGGGGGGGGGSPDTLSVSLDGAAPLNYTEDGTNHVMATTLYANNVIEFGAGMDFNASGTYDRGLFIVIDGATSGTYTMGQTGANSIAHSLMYIDNSTASHTYIADSGTVTIAINGSRITGSFDVIALDMVTQATSAMTGSFDMELVQAFYDY